MSKKLVLRILGAIMLVEAAAMIPSWIIALCYGDGDAPALLQSMIACVVPGLLLWFLCKVKNPNLRAREGLMVVSFGWILLSVLKISCSFPFRS